MMKTMSIHVKVCGVTTVDDALMVHRAGADLIGLNLFTGPRRIDLQRADEILTALPKSITPVVLLDLSSGHVPDAVRAVLRDRGASHIQMYGNITAQTVLDLRADGFEPIQVVHVSDERFADSASRCLAACGDNGPSHVLLDAADPRALGGTGRRADWNAIQQSRQSGSMAGWPKILLAGGLTPENVTHAIQAVQPWGVDVASGVESSPGIKDAAKVVAFVAAARSVTPDQTPEP